MTERSSNISTSLLALVALAILSGCGSTESDDNNVVVINNDQNVRTDNSTPNNSTPNSTPNNTPNSTPNNATNSQTTNNTANNTPGINANCPAEARPVYVVEADIDNPSTQGKLVRFDPLDEAFTDIGQLSCPVSAGDTPFSMSVDRDAVAWVLYQSGNLYRVSTTDASCEATTFQTGQQGYEVFGMGFVLNTPNTTEETLYVAGGDGPSGFDPPRIGYITFPDLALTDVAEISGWPEMSGTALAELWAFFPGSDIGSTARVARVVPATGEEYDEIDVSSAITGSPNAWAFAHWGGRFYLFYKSALDPSSSVFLVQKGGQVDEIIPNSGRYIVGAGVSTCAPTVIQ